ncbi:hypothetical protein SAMN04487830_10228 [Pseudobutyrivibrio sp. OR37]|uniref:contact-dependent growth inhibition system immunity protein n=1 Tax=Pseudobutyrivibrio sp. OR37 TaxID=1798186 RepID=UPI0008EA07C6|nr:contact-dependent growth inhibition system immunity protein [Pseudobutyrivibrio sp. OR37]SFH56636.1 hypothetical protein SAMN04487830_10228 [Pseudobutyrivibrio sp. OR37]
MTIGEMFSCKFIEGKELYPLQKWYNSLLAKTPDDIDVADVLHMFRQKMFMEFAVEKALDMLQENIFIGELWPGELLEKISMLDAGMFHNQKSKLEYIKKKGTSELKDYTCSFFEDDIQDIKNSLARIHSILEII